MSVTIDQARTIVDLAVSSLQDPQHQLVLKQILEESKKLESIDPVAATTLKFSKILPKVSEIFGAQVETVLGHSVPQNQIMSYMMQIQFMAGADPNLAVQIQKISKCLTGDFSGLYEVDEEVEEVE